MSFETHDTNRYGATATNDLIDGAGYREEVDYSVTYSLSRIKEMRGTICRVRILTDRIMGQTMCDVSYIHAILPDGRIVPVQNLLNNLTPFRELKKEMIEWAKREGVYAKGIGLIDEGNWSVVR